jgi:EF-P beta-lysylation protein EpmB
MQPDLPLPFTTARSTSWQSLWRDAIRDPRELLALLDLDGMVAGVCDSAAAQFPLRVPRGFVDRMRRGDIGDPLLRQVLPISAEMAIMPGYGLDPVGDAQARTGTGMIRKYRGRLLLIATGSCAIHCRYCFRRHFPYADETASHDRWHSAIQTVRDDETIEEIILSGGDPLSLVTARLEELTTALAALPHVKRLRIHSRLPIVLPERIDDDLISWLNRLPWPITFVVHANHANEFTADVDAALARLRATGATLLNQTVLLRGVNDYLQALTDLSERGFAAGVLPYYLHQLDHARGTAHFEVTDTDARRLHAELTARLSGYLVPRLVREIPGGTSKHPL